MKQHVQTGMVLLLIAAGLILGFLAIKQLGALLILLLIAIVITTGVDPIVTRLQALGKQRHMPRSIATLLVLFFGIFVILSVFSFLIVTAVSEAITFITETWPRFQPAILESFNDLRRQYDFIPDTAAIGQQLSAQSGRIFSYLWTTTIAIFGLLGGLFSGFTVFIFIFFFTTYKDGITYTFLQLVPPKHQQRVKEVSHQAAQRMGGWLRGQLMLALLITIMTGAAMFALGMDYAVLIAVIAGIGELIPMVGPYVAFFPALGIALATGASPLTIILLSIFFIALAQAENYILAPKIMERQVGLHPVTTILALFTGGTLLGLVGALLAIPITAAARVVMLEVVFPAIQSKPTKLIVEQHPTQMQKRSRKKKQITASSI